MKACTRCGAHLRRGHHVKLCDPCFGAVMRGADRLRSLLPMKEEWHVEARCVDPSLSYKADRPIAEDVWTGETYSRDRARPLASEMVRMVKHICATCPVRRECLFTCLQHEDVYGQQEVGVWGGTTEGERRGYKPDQVDELLTKMTIQAKEHGLMKKEAAA